MTRNAKGLVCFAFVLATLASLPGFASAGPMNLGTEDPANGLIAPLQSTGIQVASDGENAFFPFGATFDVSDAISFGPNSDPTKSNWVKSAGASWQLIDSTNQTWVHPAIAENEPPSESVGQWYLPGFVFNFAQTYYMTNVDGTISDVIIADNSYQYNGQGVATVTFGSDPFSTPEPVSMTLFGIGIAGMAGYGWRKRKQKQAATA